MSQYDVIIIGAGPEGSEVLSADDSAGGVLDLRRRDFCVIFQKSAV